MLIDTAPVKRAFSDTLIAMWLAFGWMRDEGNAFPPKPKSLPVDLGEDSKSAERESEHQPREICC
jgi:hypothetical protein